MSFEKFKLLKICTIKSKIKFIIKLATKILILQLKNIKIVKLIEMKI